MSSRHFSRVFTDRSRRDAGALRRASARRGGTNRVGDHGIVARCHRTATVGSAPPSRCDVHSNAGSASPRTPTGADSALDPSTAARHFTSPPRQGPSAMQVAIPLFPRFTALDAIGPYEVLQRIPSIDVTFVGHQRGEVRSENGMLGVTIDATFEEMPKPDIVVFPGGVGTRAARARRTRPGLGSHAPTSRRRTPPRCAPGRSCSGAPGC